MEPENLKVAETTKAPEIPVENNNLMGQEAQKAEMPEKLTKKTARISLVWKILIPALLIFTGATIYLSLNADEMPIFKGNGKEKLPEIPVVVTPEPVNPIVTAEEGKYKISFEYNTELHKFSQKGAFSNQPAYYLIESNQNSPAELENEKQLLNGYLVKISIFEDIERNVYDLAARKIEKFKLECPAQKEIGELFTSEIDGLETASFEVKTCDQEYLMHFVAFEGFVYEIAQIYRGDIGFRQSYKAHTDEIVRSIKWMRELQEIQEIPPTTIVRNERYLIEIEHPWLDETCCDVIRPSIEGLTKIAILAQMKTDEEKEESENFQQVKNKFGIFATARNKKSFELFLNEQKQALIQEYKVVEGKNPTNLLESKVIMGNKEGVKLTNYAWWGTVIFVDHSDVDAFLVFVIPNGVSKEFEGVINTILNSVKFLQKE